MAKKNTKRKNIGMVSEVTGDRIYVTRKNTSNTTEKLRLKKYNPVTRRHEWFIETNKNLGRNEA